MIFSLADGNIEHSVLRKGAAKVVAHTIVTVEIPVNRTPGEQSGI